MVFSFKKGVTVFLRYFLNSRYPHFINDYLVRMLVFSRIAVFCHKILSSLQCLLICDCICPATNLVDYYF